MTRYQLHVVRCIVQFNRVHILRQLGTGVCDAIVEAARQLPFDWWIVSSAPYVYKHTPEYVRVMTPTQCASLLSGDTFAPRGLVLDNISQPRRLGRHVINDSIAFVSTAYGKSDCKIITLSTRGFIPNVRS